MICQGAFAKSYVAYKTSVRGETEKLCTDYNYARNAYLRSTTAKRSLPGPLLTEETNYLLLLCVVSNRVLMNLLQLLLWDIPTSAIPSVFLTQHRCTGQGGPDQVTFTESEVMFGQFLTIVSVLCQLRCFILLGIRH